MLAISGLYAGLLTILVIILAFRVIGQRRQHRVGIGDGGHDSLARAIRVHGNAIETIPLSLLLLFALEMNHANPLSLHIFGTLLVVGRVLHAWGLSHKSGVSFGRYWGTVVTLLVQVTMAIGCGWLFWAAQS